MRKLQGGGSGSKLAQALRPASLRHAGTMAREAARPALLAGCYWAWHGQSVHRLLLLGAATSTVSMPSLVSLAILVGWAVVCPLSFSAPGATMHDLMHPARHPTMSSALLQH